MDTSLLLSLFFLLFSGPTLFSNEWEGEVVILTGWIQNQLVRVFNRLVSSIMGYSESDPWLNTFVDFHWMSPNHNKQKLSPMCLFTCINTLMSKKPVYTTLNTDRVLHRGTVFVYINFLFIVSEIFCSTIQRWVAKCCCLKYGFRMSGDQCQVWRLNTGAISGVGACNEHRPGRRERKSKTTKPHVA